MADVDYDGKPKKVNCFEGGLFPKYGLMAFEKKKLTLYQGIPGKGQKSRVFKYADMDYVYPVNIWGISPTGFVIMMKDGSRYKFSITGRNQFLPWLQERIDACQPKGSRPKALIVDPVESDESEDADEE